MALLYIRNQDNIITYNHIVEDILILSPSMYWFKLCSIPTKNKNKAKKIALHMLSDKPSSFDELALYRLDAMYHAYAYDKDLLKDMVRKFNFQNPKIYFANQLQLSQPVAIDDSTLLYSFKDRVMEMTIGSNKPESHIKDVYNKLLQEQTYISGFEKSTKKNTMFLTISLAFFIGYMILFSIDKAITLSNVNNELATLKANNRSFYEIKSLIKRYEKLDKESKKLKKELTKSLQVTNLKSLVYEKGSIKVENE